MQTIANVPFSSSSSTGNFVVDAYPHRSQKVKFPLCIFPVIHEPIAAFRAKVHINILPWPSRVSQRFIFSAFYIRLCTPS